MKQIYFAPEMTLCLLEKEDILTASVSVTVFGTNGDCYVEDIF